jgi:hypothetical protein
VYRPQLASPPGGQSGTVDYSQPIPKTGFVSGFAGSVAGTVAAVVVDDKYVQGLTAALL